MIWAGSDSAAGLGLTWWTYEASFLLDNLLAFEPEFD